jgi:LPXTG-motif cell wall-anchored protein
MKTVRLHLFGAALALGLVLAGAAAPAASAAEDYITNNPPQVLGETLTRKPAAAGTSAARSLPITGGDMAGLTALGLGAIATGSVMVRRSRRTA